jgi:alanine racemase
MIESHPSAWAEVDLNALTHNVRLLRAALRPPAQLMAVVKANAYGHGAVPVAQTALAHGATWLGVARVREGSELRAAGIAAPILVLGPSAPSEAGAAVRARLRVSIASPLVARALSEQSQQQGTVTAVHIKVDTGMSRFGVLATEALAFARAIHAMPELRLEGVFTHFASADEQENTFTHTQVDRFRQVLRELQEADIAVPVHHAANSAGTLAAREFHFDLARAGIALYGIAPSEDLMPRAGLQPALSLKSRVALVKELPAGASIGYGRTHICERPTRVALVSIGYADGVRRVLSNRGEVLIRGARARMLGRVSMDQLVVSVDGIDAFEGDEVTLIGKQGEARIAIEEFAGWAGTIPYEVLTGIGARVPRVYL